MEDNQIVKKTDERLQKMMAGMVQGGYDPDAYLSLVKKMLLNNGGQVDNLNEAMMFFLAAAKRSGLDPMQRQIYAVFRQDHGKAKMTIITSIDGFRVIAERSGIYGGSDDAVFEEKDGKPTKATVTVYRINEKTGERYPVTASARFEEYAQKKYDGSLMPNWAKMPFVMLAKCAEALALRKAFPNSLGGLYTDEEMQQADNLPAPTVNKNKVTVPVGVNAQELVNKIKAGELEVQNGN